MKQIVVFTDLDGTLLDHDTYDFKEAEAVLQQLKSRAIPVIICSSKTRAEIEFYRRRMGLSGPFIVENGGAIFVPQHDLNLGDIGFVGKGPYRVVELGLPYATLCRIWNAIKMKGKFRMKGFNEMTVEEIVDVSGLSLEEASLAAKREYSEPFMFSDTSDQFQLLERLSHGQGVMITRGGRFYHLIGQNDKGRAVEVLKRVYADTYPDRNIWTAGLGDSANDVPMLKQVDMPIVIRKKSGEWERVPEINPIYSDKPGPGGWAEVIQTIL